MIDEAKFQSLAANGYEHFFSLIEVGHIVCPFPDLWDNFWREYVKPTTGNDLMPLILSSWEYCTNEEKNERFKEQLLIALKTKSKTDLFSFFESYTHKNRWCVNKLIDGV